MDTFWNNVTYMLLGFAVATGMYILVFSNNGTGPPNVVTRYEYIDCERDAAYISCITVDPVHTEPQARFD